MRLPFNRLPAANSPDILQTLTKKRWFSTVNPLFQVQSERTSKHRVTDAVEVILLYRALLRQCSYLPDSAARAYIHGYVISRFRRYQPRPASRPKQPSVCRRKASLTVIKLQLLLHNARKSLKSLQRANDGHPRHLTKVLSMTYGRSGKLRRELISAYQRPKLTLASHVAEDPEESGLSHELVAVLKSQIKQPAPNFSRSPLKSLEPEIPENNIWQRPLPKSREKNLRKKWLAKTLDKLMPPLEHTQWNRLRGLASGAARWEGPVARRPKGRPLFSTGEIDDDDDAPTMMRSSEQPDCVHVLPPHNPKRLVSSRGRFVEEAMHPKMLSRPHKITASYMRSIWRVIFQRCPRLDWNAEREKWTVTWGNVERERRIVLDTKREVAVEMFEGVKGDGKILKE
ncbi:MAG: hypothetical protein Q9190_001895 [Brigantiaea leucoxantha]